MRGFLGSAALGALAVGFSVLSSPVMATAFGPATVGFTSSSAPSYTTGATTGAVTFNSPLAIGARTGVFANASSNNTNPAGLFANSGQTGVGNGVVTFSLVVGTTLNESLASLFTFTDPSAGTFTFNATSVETTQYSTASGSASIALYIMGVASGGNAGFTGTPTSVTVSLTDTFGIVNDSNTLSNPPDPDPNPPAGPGPAAVPEPATLALLGVSLLGLGVMRRRSK